MEVKSIVDNYNFLSDNCTKISLLIWKNETISLKGLKQLLFSDNLETNLIYLTLKDCFKKFPSEEVFSNEIRYATIHNILYLLKAEVLNNEQEMFIINQYISLNVNNYKCKREKQKVKVG